MQNSSKGLAYLHEVGVAHRDCSISNMVMAADKMFPHGFHPNFLTKDMRARRLRGVRSRTHVGGMKYYLIDFGESMKFDSTENVRIDVWSKASIHAPETLDDDRPPYDPFKVDVWAAGTTYTNVIVKEYPGYFEAFSPLFSSMASEDPAARPSAAEALAQFRAIKSQFSRTALHSRVRFHEACPEIAVQRVFRDGWHWLKQFAFAARNMKCYKLFRTIATARVRLIWKAQCYQPSGIAAGHLARAAPHFYILHDRS
ncbi:hypothetical protein EWM64_g8711 [Hericium alpestre]|uniref:Protein kinase domain-containing protein n=1 Tax=Hericium alpestre TaxID=135208 RepID=A0A4Y9ZKN5_9AGAM|nr:hypothetical protein EWM64_g8711 [Hericium alpestre]